MNNDLGLVNKTDDARDANVDLHLRSGSHLRDTEFLEKVERFIGKSLRPKKGGWPKGKRRV